MSTCAACLKRRVEEPAASEEGRSNALSEGIVLLQCDSSHFHASGGFQPTATAPTATAPTATAPTATVPTATVPTATVPTATVPTVTGRRCMPI